MAYIPIDLWREILVRIRVEELMRLRCVCSSWRILIDCSTFRAQHSTRPSKFPAQNLILLSRKVYYMLGLEKISPSNEPISEPIRARVIRIKSEIDHQHHICGLDHSVNGLVLVFDRLFVKTDGVYAWNPFTGRHHNLHVSDIISKEKGYDMYYGIGFDKFTRDCKVVFIRHRRGIPSTDVFVCKLRSPSCWKLMHPLPLQALRFHSSLQRDGVFVSGALHWMVKYQNDVVAVQNNRQLSVSVLAIDLGTENYNLISLPFKTFPEVTSSGVVLCVLGGCLCMSLTYTHPGRLKAWVMKEYGLVDSPDSWSMMYVVELQELGRQLYITKTARPVAYSDCGSQVLISLGGDLVWYHLQNKTLKHIELEGWQDLESWCIWNKRSFTATEHAGSFLPMGCELEIPASMQREGAFK